LAAYINFVLLFREFQKQGIYRYARGWGRFVLQIVAANGAMVLLLCALLSIWPNWSVYSWNLRVLYLGVMCSAGIAAYFAVLLLMGLRPKHLKLQV
jgi:putative peptidoglycan lipid II flippase